MAPPASVPSDVGGVGRTAVRPTKPVSGRLAGGSLPRLSGRSRRELSPSSRTSVCAPADFKALRPTEAIAAIRHAVCPLRRLRPRRTA